MRYHKQDCVIFKEKKANLRTLREIFAQRLNEKELIILPCVLYNSTSVNTKLSLTDSERPRIVSFKNGRC
ncbi:hypothetical protein TNCT_524941 [Trichonephila clavata]|uniref:Uncharacterized protein n=1 Tax=Trichonephila clavata TaxID=2740835 RepID=A0A8X6LRC5_TRICU|nr:hypothetical protein TNCT_524941 [Trichonephila clavata]